MMKVSDYLYFDYNASAPLRFEILEIIQKYGLKAYNPSAMHEWGREAKKALEQSRDSLFNLLNISRSDYEIVFTSGATEVNNWVLQSFKGPVLVSSVEHSSVLNACPMVDILPVDSSGKVDLNRLEGWLLQQSKPALVCVMYANNETGVIQDIAAISKLCQQYGAYFHCDAVQALGKQKIDFSLFSSCALSAHKIGGFGGVGCCVIKKNWELPALIKGGGQEQYRRSGTENLIGALSFAVALEKALEEQDSSVWDRVKTKRDYLEENILKSVPDVYIAGRSKESDLIDRLQNTSLVCLPDVKSEKQVIFMDLHNIGVSAGAACSSGRIMESHVLKAMGLDPRLSLGALRISMGPNTRDADIDRFLEVWCKMIDKFGVVASV